MSGFFVPRPKRPRLPTRRGHAMPQRLPAVTAMSHAPRRMTPILSRSDRLVCYQEER
jgi:hypothetical protein